jgi:hypothetical protein
VFNRFRTRIGLSAFFVSYLLRGAMRVNDRLLAALASVAIAWLMGFATCDQTRLLYQPEDVDSPGYADYCDCDYRFLQSLVLIHL